MLNIFCFSAQGRAGVSGLQAVELRKVKQIQDNNHGLNDKKITLPVFVIRKKDLTFSRKQFCGNCF